MADDDAGVAVVGLLEAEPPGAEIGDPAGSVNLPGHHDLAWWKLALALMGVWIPAVGIGCGLYYWWFADLSVHKSVPVFAVLVYVVGSTVAALLLAMVDRKPLVAAVAIAVMTAPFASCAGAAPLYGHYYCQHAPRCAAGILPY